MTDQERDEIRAIARAEARAETRHQVSTLLAELLVGLLSHPRPELAHRPGAPPAEPAPPTVDQLLGKIADAGATDLPLIEEVERLGPNRPEVFAALRARQEALRDAPR